MLRAGVLLACIVAITFATNSLRSGLFSISRARNKFVLLSSVITIYSTRPHIEKETALTVCSAGLTVSVEVASAIALPTTPPRPHDTAATTARNAANRCFLIDSHTPQKKPPRVLPTLSGCLQYGQSTLRTGSVLRLPVAAIAFTQRGQYFSVRFLTHHCSAITIINDVHRFSLRNTLISGSCSTTMCTSPPR